MVCDKAGSGDCLVDEVRSFVSLIFRERSVLFFDIQVNINTTTLPPNNRLHLLLNSLFLQPEYRFYQDCILLLCRGSSPQQDPLTCFSGKEKSSGQVWGLV